MRSPKRGARVGADVEAEPTLGHVVVRCDAALGIRVERDSRDDVARQLGLVRERVGAAELLGHLSPDEYRVGTPSEVCQDAELVVDLGPAGDEHERPLDVAEQPAEHLELLLEQEPGVGREEVRDALGRRVCAMRRSESVEDEEVPRPPRAGARTRDRSSSLRDRSGCSRAPRSAGRAAAPADAPRPAPSRTRGRGPSAFPRCEHTATCAASRSRRSRRVGREARIRVSSATRPSSRGTFRSARTSTRFPATSASRTERGRCTREGACRSRRRADTSSPTRCRTSRTPSPCSRAPS